jgi:hydrogenase maturation protein HypF
MAENDLESTMGIALDGYGYGVDGNAWGGEILFCERDHFERVGHIEEQPYLGGDLAAKYPARMVYAILSKVGLGKEWAMSNLSKFPYKLEEMKILSEELKRKHYISTSSCGRILDAIAALLDICHVRTYEGEPAMKLESFAIGANKKYSVKPIIKHDILMTTPLLEKLYYEIGKTSPKELAYAGEEYLASGIAELVIQKAKEYKIKNISFSGGVAYNEHISNRIRTTIESNGLIFHRKKYAPPGDGCISLGQAFIVGKWKLR